MDTLLSHWQDLVTVQADRIIVHEAGSGRFYTVREIDQAARERASIIGESGLRGRAIAFVEENGGSWFSTFFAILHAGGIAVPLESDQCPSDRNVYQAMRCNGIFRNGKLEVMETGSYGLPEDLCLAKVTSGSTGHPKLFFFRDSEMLADGRNILATMGMCRTDLQYAAIPLGHSYGLGNLVLPLIMEGIPLVVASGIYPQVMITEMRHYKVSVFPAVPLLLRALARVESPANPLPRLRLIISAGAALEPGIARAFTGRFTLNIHNFYGSSETGGLCYDRGGRGTEEGPTVGLPLKGVMIQQSPDGSLGVRSEAVYSFENPHAASHWFPLPDNGRFDAHGNLFLTGRRRAFLKIGARRLDPREIEDLAITRAGVEFAWVSTCASGQGDRVGLVYEGAVSPVEMKSILETALPAWKRPARIRQIKAVPRTARGKVAVPSLQTILDSSL